MTQDTHEELSFGESLSKLEDIVRKLESGRLELEDSLVLYEEGVGLIQVLQSKLDTAEQKVTVLLGGLEPEVEEGDL